MPPLRLALIGAGQITRNSHLPAALSSNAVMVTAIVDPVVERARELAREFGIDPAVAGESGSVAHLADAALIATPNDSHKAIALTCLDAGLDVLIEKPLAVNASEGRAIVERAEALGRIVAVGYVTRFRESTLLMKDLLESGYFGRVKRFVHQFGTVGGWAPLSAYNLDVKATGGGVLVVTGTHFLDRMLHWWGRPDTVSLEDDGRGGPEANCVASFTYSRKGQTTEGLARYSKTAALRNGFVMETDAGTVLVADREDAEILLRPIGRGDLEHCIRRTPSRKNRRTAFETQIDDFAAACLARTQPLVNGRQGLSSLELLEELYGHRRPLQGDWSGTEVSR